MPPTTVVNRKHTQKYDVYIGRPSKWGNPFRIGQPHPERPRHRMTRAEVIECYEKYLLSRPKLLKALPELRGKVLACWCAPEQCHGDVLAAFADLAPKVAVIDGIGEG